MTNNTEEFKKFLNLRYQAKLTPHHSGNKVIDSYHFCNIKREWDKVSQYIINKCINNTELSVYDKIKNIFLARIYNRVETLEGLGYPKKQYNIKEEDLLYKQNPHAYRVQKFITRLAEDYKYESSVWEVANYLDQVFRNIDKYTWDESFERTFKNFCEILDLHDQSFICYQCALDVDYLFRYKDIDDFVVIGPGAIRGLNMIYYSDKFDAVYKDDFTQKLKNAPYYDLLKQLHNEVKNIIPGVYLTLNDVEFDLCEYCKWYSISSGFRTVQRKF